MAIIFLGILALVVWVFVAFVAAVPSGWAHLPFALGVTLIAVGIVDRDEARRTRDSA